MADRTIVVRLGADDQLSPAFKRAAGAAGELGREAEGAGRKVKEVKPGDAMKDLAPRLLAVGAGFGIVAARISDFESQMSKVDAYLMPTTENLGRLREAAIQAGNDTKYSAGEAAQAITEMGKAGMSTADILSGGLTGAMNLAAAGTMEVGQAAETIAVSLKQFELDGSNAAHVADLLAAGAGKAVGEVTDMAMALKQSGLVAKQTGLSIEDTTGALAAFANAGLIGSDAGTSLKTMLQRLTPQSKEARDKMAELGISAYDAHGGFIGLSAFAQNLRDSMVNLAPEARNSAMAIIFGADAVRAANVLYNEGSEGIQKWTQDVNEAGYAARVAAKLSDNLAGDIERLGSAVDTAIIGKGGSLNNILRGLVQGADALVSAIGALPTPVVVAGAALASLLMIGPKFAALGTSIGTTLTGGIQRFATAIEAAQAPTAAAIASYKALGFSAEAAGRAAAASAGGFSASKAAMSGLSTAGGGMLSMLGGPWGVALMGATALVTSFAAKKAEAAQTVRTFTQAIESDTGALGANTAAQVAMKLESDGILKSLQSAGVSVADFTAAVMGQGDAYERVLAQLSSVSTEMQKTYKETSRAGMESAQAANSQAQLSGKLQELRGQLGEASEAHSRQAEATKAATSATGGAKDAVKLLSDAQVRAKETTEGLNSAIALLNGQLSEREIIDAFTRKVISLNDATKGNTDALVGNSASALDNRAKMHDLVKAGTEVLNVLIKKGATMPEVTAKANELAKQIDAAGAASNFAAKETQEYSDMLRNVPKTAETLISADTATASARVKNIRAELDGLRDKTVNVLVNVNRITRNQAALDDLRNADGNVYAAAYVDGGIRAAQHFANGGTTEQHIAQIAPAGAWRVWAEPETGGEAYIPLSPAKRPRSYSILDYVARNYFDSHLVPMANGGTISAGSAAPIATESRIPNLLVRVHIGNEQFLGTIRSEVVSTISGEMAFA